MTIALPTLPCKHASHITGDPNAYECQIGHAVQPPRIYCETVCPIRISGIEEARMKDPSKFLTEPPPRKWGLGDIVEKGISVVTFGQGKRLADKLAKKQGKKGCGCQKRKEALNKLGKKVGI